jgi:transcriptional regulator with GAF, ATPase, and Fis domain
MMSVDENVFFHEATLRLCSSLDIQTVLERCFEYIGLLIPVTGMSLGIGDTDLNVLRYVAWVGTDLPAVSEQVVAFPEKGRNERAALWKKGEVIKIINQPDAELGFVQFLERLGLKPNVSAMIMVLNLEGNRVGEVGLIADGLNQYTDEHARLLRLLHESFAIAMSNALKHQEVSRLKDMLADDNRFLHGDIFGPTGSQES